MQNEKVFRMDDWTDDFTKNCEKGSLVADEVVDCMINAVPPIRMGYLTQVGSAHSTVFDKERKIYRSTYTTFVSVGKGLWRFVGFCFAGCDKEPA